MKAIWFGRHLYEPLLYVDQKNVEISPVPLNKGERQLVDDLKAYHGSNASRFFVDKELYLLRNLSKGRGVGFFEAGNFHPDFILWLLIVGQQHVIFVDPKGIRNLGPTDPKIQLSSRAPKLVDESGTVGDESAAGDVKAAGKDRGQSVPRGQRDDQIAMNDRQCSDRNSRRLVALYSRTHRMTF
jgi:hypothetical protein